MPSPAATKAPPPPPPAPGPLADLALRALVEEALLTPKPGLVDRRGPGAHDDLSLDLMLRSAESLRATFWEVASACRGSRLDQNLRRTLGAIGRDGEAAMLEATGGANAHRGAIWTLGLLVAGTVLARPEREQAPGARLPSERSPGERLPSERIAATAAAIARLPDPHGVPSGTNGARVSRVYGVAGARGEARGGFPRVIGTALPTLRAGRRAGLDGSAVRLDALVGIMAALDDTCVLHRGGPRGLRIVQRGAARVLEAGGASAPAGRRALAALERALLEKRLSPGGSADLLAAAIFLESLEERGTEERKDRRWKA